MRTPLLSLALTTVVLAAGPAAGAATATTRPALSARTAVEPIALKYKWEQDTPLRYHITQRTDALMSGMPGQEEMTVSQSQTMRVRMDITDVADDGAATVRTTLEGVSFEMTPPMAEKISYDSDAQGLAEEGGEPEHPAAKAMAAFVGESFTFEITPRGDVRNVQGMDEILQKIADAAADPAMQEMFRGKFGNQSMEAMLEQAFKTLPEETVTAGDSWETTVDQVVPALGTLHMQSTMTLDRLEPDDGRQLARIPIAMSISLDRTNTDDSGLPPGTTLTMEDASGKGVMMFDVDRGQVKHMEMVSTMPMRMSMKMGDETMDIKQDITSTMRMERVDAAGSDSE